eukprot:5715046-Pyramimonas_sp.AAC.1
MNCYGLQHPQTGTCDGLASGRGHIISACRISRSKLGPYACQLRLWGPMVTLGAVSYTHLRAHETGAYL